MKRETVEDVLLRIGIPAGLDGFKYIVDSMDIFEELGENIGITKVLYPEIAKRNNTKPSRTERSIRHALQVARKKGDPGTVERYIGVINTNNSSSLMQLYMILKREKP